MCDSRPHFCFFYLIITMQNSVTEVHLQDTNYATKSNECHINHVVTSGCRLDDSAQNNSWHERILQLVEEIGGSI